MVPTRRTRVARNAGRRQRWPSRLRRDTGGSVSVEFALSTTLILVPMLLGLSDLTLYTLSIERVDRGGAAAVLYVIANADGTNTTAITSGVVAATRAGADDDTLSVTVDDVFMCFPTIGSPTRQSTESPPCSDGDDPVHYVEVVASSQYVPLFDYPFVDPTIPVSLTTRVRVGGGDG